MEVVNSSQLIASLVIGIILLVFLMLKTKLHSFIAILLSAIVIGFISGIPSGKISNAIVAGFGGTIGSIGIIIGFGVMMGQLFEVSGAAETMAKTFIKLLGKGRERIAMAITGFVVSIPIFCDSGFIILFPIAKSISKKTKISIITLGVALAAGLVITHSLVPPTPGPVGVAGIFGVSVGSLLMLGLLISVPMVIAAVIYAGYLGNKIYQLPADKSDEWVRPTKVLEREELDIKSDKTLPSVVRSFLPIVLPILLILMGTVTKALYPASAYANLSESFIKFLQVSQFLGTPVIAVGIGMISCIYLLTSGISRQETLSAMDLGIKSAGIIILLTGAGGALGQVIRDSGAGKYIAEQIAQTPIPPIIIPFVVASVIRIIQGSGTVAMLTSASITAPIIANMGANPLFAAMAACVGSLIFSHFNDSFFWVVNRSMGITDVKEQMRVWSVTTTIAWAVGFVTLMIIYMVAG